MYNYIKKNKSIKDHILEMNGLSLDDINKDFIPEYNQDVLINFKEELLALRDKKFFIIGDYDVDGIFSTVIISKLFNYLNIKHNFYIPSRIKEGYGLSIDLVNKAKQYDFDCILTLDNGIVANDAITLAKQLELEVLIIDHHEYIQLPECRAIIHPNLLNQGYRDLCTAGLTCLLSKLFYDDEYSTVLGGIGTLADMVKVLDYNRYLLKKSLCLLNSKSFYQINILSKKKQYTYEDLSYTVIPKINAISRLDYNVNMIVKYFLADSETCFNTAKDIDQLNQKRKDLTTTMYQKALTLVQDEPIIILEDESFYEGLCGLLANRISEEFQKPCLVLAHNEGLYKGSGRSIGSFNIYEYLKECDGLFEKYGGHDKAIGLSIKKENLSALKQYIETHPFKIQDNKIDVLELSINDINLETYNDIQDLQPFGTGFKEPLYAINDYTIISKYMIKGQYPKYHLDNEIDAISFKCQKDEFKTIICHMQKDNYRQEKVSLIIDDFVI